GNRAHFAGEENILNALKKFPKMGSVAALPSNVYKNFPAVHFSKQATAGGVTLRLDSDELNDAGFYGINFFTPAIRSLILLLGQATKEQAADILKRNNIPLNHRGEARIGVAFVEAVYSRFHTEHRTRISA